MLGGFIAPLEMDDEDYMDAIYDAFVELSGIYNAEEGVTADADKDDKKISLLVEGDDGENSTRIYSEYNVNTGFLNIFEFSSTEVEGSDTTTIDFAIKLKQSLFDRIPFNWAFSLVGIAILGLGVLVLRKRK